VRLRKKSTEKTDEVNGQHDFDPLLISRKYHLKRSLHPLTGSNAWIDMYGTAICLKIWAGAELDQMEAADAPGRT
jgi:hypothetical protein